MKIQRITFPLTQSKVFLAETTKKDTNNEFAKNNQYNTNNIFYYPLNFGNRRRNYSSTIPELQMKTENFHVCKFDNIPCPCCGKIMLPRTKYNNIAYKLDKYVKPEEYLDYLGQYTEYMRPVEESVYNQLQILSAKTGEKDIRTLLLNLRDIKLPELEKQQYKQLRKLKVFSKHLSENEKKLLDENIAKVEAEIDRKNTQAVFRRKVVIDRMSKIPIKNKKKYNKLQKLVKDFPTSGAMDAAWIVKYSGLDKNNQPWTSNTIAKRFLMNSIPNTDHILAYDIEQGHDDITNYMAMHNSCNGQKENKPFIEWINEDKDNRIKNMRKYFLGIQELIDNNKLNDIRYKDYVAFATQRIRNLSNNKIKVFEDGQFELTEQQKELLNRHYEKEITDEEDSTQ